LLDRIETRSQADVLTKPKIIALAGQQAQLAIQEMMYCVTSVQATNGSAVKSASISYNTDLVGLGIVLDVLPEQEDHGQWRLHVRASNTEFLGYDNYGKKNKGSVSNPGGKPIGYEMPHPHFRAVEADAEDSLMLGQTMALRGPLWTVTTKTKGHFLMPAKTKTIRQRLYVFVTPTPRPRPS
jgi:hypothetical protein